MAHRWLWILDDEGPGQMGDVVSHTSTVKNELNRQADRIGAKAAALLATIPEHRTGQSQIKVTHSGRGTLLDAYVALEDPNGGAAAIEFGWRQVRLAEETGELTYGHEGLKILARAIGG